MPSQKTPSAPKFRPASFTALDASTLAYNDPAALNTAATDADVAAYARSDADFAARHPELLAANRANEANIAGQIDGKLPPGYAATLTRAGLGSALGTFEGGGVAPGTTGAFGVARNLGLDFLKYQDDARTALAQANAQAPERQIGLGGNAVVGLTQANDTLANQVAIGNFQGANQVAIANTGNANNAAQGSFAAALNANNAQGAQNAQLALGAAKLGASLYGQYGGSIANNAGASIFSDAQGYGGVAQSVANAAGSAG